MNSPKPQNLEISTEELSATPSEERQDMKRKQNSFYFIEKFEGKKIDLSEVELSNKYEYLDDVYKKTFPFRKTVIKGKGMISKQLGVIKEPLKIKHSMDMYMNEKDNRNLRKVYSASLYGKNNLKISTATTKRPNAQKNQHIKNLFIVDEPSFREDLINKVRRDYVNTIKPDNNVPLGKSMDSSFEGLDDHDDDTNKEKVPDEGMIIKDINIYTKYYSLSDLRILWKCSEIVLIVTLNDPITDKQGRLKVGIKEKPTILKSDTRFQGHTNDLIWPKGGKKDFNRLVDPLDTLLIFCKMAQEEFPFYMSVLGFDILQSGFHSELGRLISLN